MTLKNTKDSLIAKTFDLVGETFNSDESAMGSFIEACFGRDEFKNKSVLDAGCGMGVASIYFARNGAAKVTGIDISEKSLEAALRQSAAAGLKNTVFTKADLAKIPFGDGAFDIVFTVGALPYVDDIGASLRELARVLAPGGTLLILSLKRTKLDGAFEAVRKILGRVPSRYVLPFSKILALLLKPISPLILKRQETGAGKTLQQTIIEAFFIPAQLHKYKPEEIEERLKGIQVTAGRVLPPYLSFCSPATVFIIKGTKNLKSR